MGQNNLGDRGTTRGGGTPIKVVVKSDGVAVAGLTVTAQAPSISGTTDANGVASFTLPAGQYTITVSDAAGSASKSVAVVESTTTEIVALALAPKTS